jgi:nitroreductase
MCPILSQNFLRRKIMQIKNTIEAIRARYSCRSFSEKVPSDADLQTIVHAALAAPSAMNNQPWRVIVVTNPELLAELEAEAVNNLDSDSRERINSRGGKVYYSAPCQIIIPVPDGKWADTDCGIISQNVALAAESLGINSLICGMIRFSFMGEKGGYFKRKLGFPEGFEPGLSVLLGYADEAGIKEPHELDLSKISVVK